MPTRIASAPLSEVELEEADEDVEDEVPDAFAVPEAVAAVPVAVAPARVPDAVK